MNALHPGAYYSDQFTTLGERISVARERAGLSQAELAERLAIQRKTLDSWEDDNAEPRSNKLIMLAGILGVSPGWLLSGVGEGVPAPTEAAESLGDDAALAERLLSELRDAQAMQSQIAERMARIEDALASIAAA